MQSVTSHAVNEKISSIEEGYHSLMANETIPTSAYTTLSLISGRKLSDYDFIDFYAGLYVNSIYYPKGFMRIPSFMFKSESELGKIFRVDIPLVGSNESVSFRYNNDTSVDCRGFNNSGTLYAKILGEKIFFNN